MYTHMTHINTMFADCHAAVILDNVDVFYLENGNVFKQILIKLQLYFFLVNFQFILR